MVGKSKLSEYGIWRGIKQRCLNPRSPSYMDYGGRGITICERWRDSFESFYTDMGARPSADHSIDRFPDNDGNYEPGNCRWATSGQQAHNKREQQPGTRAKVLSAHHVYVIRALYDSRYHPRAIGQMFGLTESNVFEIGKRFTWQHIGEVLVPSDFIDRVAAHLAVVTVCRRQARANWKGVRYAHQSEFGGRWQSARIAHSEGATA